MADALVATDENWESEVLKSNIPVMVDFWAPWCGPCRMIGPIVEELGKEYTGKVKVMKLNVDDNKKMPAKYGVRGIPTVILFKNGSVLEQVVGAVPKSQLDALVKKAI